jgi:hypothetical protein
MCVDCRGINSGKVLGLEVLDISLCITESVVAAHPLFSKNRQSEKNDELEILP